MWLENKRGRCQLSLPVALRWMWWCRAGWTFSSTTFFSDWKNVDSRELKLCQDMSVWRETRLPASQHACHMPQAGRALDSPAAHCSWSWSLRDLVPKLPEYMAGELNLYFSSNFATVLFSPESDFFFPRECKASYRTKILAPDAISALHLELKQKFNPPAADTSVFQCCSSRCLSLRAAVKCIRKITYWLKYCLSRKREELQNSPRYPKIHTMYCYYHVP